MAHERLTEPRVTVEWLPAKSRCFSNFPAFSYIYIYIMVVNEFKSNEAKVKRNTKF